MNHTEAETRDVQICQQYVSGNNTQQELATAFQLTKSRIQQILREHGFTMKDRLKRRSRSAFTGVHLSQGVKEALRGEAVRTGTSMSSIVSNLVVDELKHRGITVIEEPVYTGEPLPLEDN
jgi:hypothetical protein